MKNDIYFISTKQNIPTEKLFCEKYFPSYIYYLHIDSELDCYKVQADFAPLSLIPDIAFHQMPKETRDFMI